MSGLMYFNQRKVYISPELAGQKIKIFETLDGLEAEDERGRLYFLSDYKTKICRPLWHYSDGAWQEDVSIYYFKPIRVSKRLETENQRLRVEETNDDSSNCGSSDKICARSAVAYRL